MRIFLDTNVLVSALTTRGLCAELFERVVLFHDLVVGEPVLVELERVLKDKLRVPPAGRTSVLAMLREFELAPASGDLGKIRFRDAADRAVLACSVAAQVDIIATGDKALQDLTVVGGIPIVSPRVFWERILAQAALGK